MKVNQTGSPPVQKREVAESGRAKGSAPVREGKPTRSAERARESGSKLEISDKAKQSAKAKAVASEAPDVRDSRVAELKKKIADGSYKVDSEALADRIVEEHLRTPGLG